MRLIIQDLMVEFLVNLKNIVIVNIFLILVSSSFANETIKVHYINGVYNLRIEAKKTADLISIEFYGEEKNVNTFYSPTGFNEKDSNEKHLGKDILEVLYQKSKESVSDLDKRILKNHLKKAITHNGFFNEYYKDRSKEIYKLLKKSPHKYHFLINHSQGNLVSNQMCEYIKDKDPRLYERMYAYGFGVPSNHISCGLKNKDQDNHSYTTFRFDNVINSLRLAAKTMYPILEPLPANIVSNENSIFSVLSVHYMSNYLSEKKSLTKFTNDFFNNLPKKFDFKNTKIADFLPEDVNIKYDETKLEELLVELNKCQIEKKGCNVQKYKKKLIKKEEIDEDKYGEIVNRCSLMTVSTSMRNNKGKGALEKCVELTVKSLTTQYSPKELKISLDYDNENPLKKYSNNKAKELLDKISLDLKKNYSLDQLLSYIHSKYYDYSYKNMKVSNTKEVLDLAIFNVLETDLNIDNKQLYYPKALTMYDFFLAEFYKDRNFAEDSLRKIKFYCQDKSHLTCINNYNTRSIASEREQ